LALAVPLSRFTSRVGGGSAFFVRPHYTFTNMKTIILRPSVLLTIIAILTGFLVYEIHLRHLAWRNHQKFEIAVFDQLFQSLDRGDTQAAKLRLGALVTVTSDYYEQQYGHETDTNFLPRLAEAKIIKAEHEANLLKQKQEAMSVPSK